VRLGSFGTRELQVMYVCDVMASIRCVRNRVSLAAVGAGEPCFWCRPTFRLSFLLRCILHSALTAANPNTRRTSLQQNSAHGTDMHAILLNQPIDETNMHLSLPYRPVANRARPTLLPAHRFDSTCADMRLFNMNCSPRFACSEATPLFTTLNPCPFLVTQQWRC
jgi:hypothetical protein